MTGIRRVIWILALASGMSSALTASAAEDNEPEFQLYGEILGGYFSDEALKASSGRETQIWKMTRVILGTNVFLNDSPWSARIELAPLADEVKHDPKDAAYVDYYKNLGTDLLYYGEYPVREAFARYQRRSVRLTVGRMINFHGLSLERAPYLHRHDAPHAYYIDKELVTGGRLDLQAAGFTLSLGVFGGRGNPNLSYNHYLDGAADPNIKGNNTPLLEAQLNYRYKRGGFAGMLFTGYHRTKTGSAPGSLYSGKHNDDRLNGGVDIQYATGMSVLTGMRVLAQYSQYTFGLTESGTQGRKTPKQALNIEKDGYFVTVSLQLFNDVSVQYTYEKLDRMDTKVWDKVANLTQGHSSFDSDEINTIYSLSYHGIRNVTLSAFYRAPEFDYQTVSGIRAEDGVDKMGATLAFVF